MRIGLDARFYGPTGKGIGRYLEKLIARLEKLDTENEYFIFLRQENFDLYKSQNNNFHKVLANYPWYSWQEQILLPIKLKKYKLDLVHFPHFNVPIFYRGRFVITVHDLTLLAWPTRGNGIRRLFYFFKHSAFIFILKNAVKRSEQIIVDSGHTKKDLINKLRIPAHKVKVIYLAS